MTLLEFDPWARKILWSRKWQPTAVLLLKESHGPRSLVDYSPQGHKRVRQDLEPKQQTQVEDLIHVFRISRNN